MQPLPLRLLSAQRSGCTDDGDLEPRISTRTTVTGDPAVGVDGRRSVPFTDEMSLLKGIERQAEYNTTTSGSKL